MIGLDTAKKKLPRASVKLDLTSKAPALTSDKLSLEARYLRASALAPLRLQMSMSNGLAQFPLNALRISTPFCAITRSRLVVSR